jgi:hypothetical protein
MPRRRRSGAWLAPRQRLAAVPRRGNGLAERRAAGDPTLAVTSTPHSSARRARAPARADVVRRRRCARAAAACAALPPPRGACGRRAVALSLAARNRLYCATAARDLLLQ